MPFIPDQDSNGFSPDVNRPDRGAIAADVEKYSKEANRSMGRRFLSALPGAVADTVIKNPIKFAASAALSPIDIGRGLVGKQPVQTRFPLAGQTYQAEAGQRAGQIIEGEKPLYHALAPFAEVPLAAAETVGLGKGTSKLLSKTKGMLDARAETKAIKDALEITKPKLSPKEQVKAYERGRGYKEGLFRGKVGVSASDRDVEVAEAASKIVSKNADEFENIGRLDAEVKESAAKVRAGFQQLGDSGAIWNSNELKGYVNRVNLPITVRSDISLNNQAKNLKSAIVELAEKQQKKPEGLLDLRQDFDELISKEYPNLYDKENTPIRQYIKNLRRVLNDFAEDKVPEGTFPDGTNFKAELRRQHLLLEAKENIAEKAPPIGSTRFSRFREKFPASSGALKYGLGTAVGGSIIGGATYGALNSK